ncbi:MAG: hypothetical protein ABSF55_02705 [Candidatus Staskawiczbacteria bacterium]|jgi:hypothetical protein
MEEQQPQSKKYSVSTIIITSVAVIIIFILAFLFYYYSTMPAPVAPQESAPVTTSQQQPPAPQIIPTNIITFAPPATLPTVQKNGKCFASSIAEPYRQDAFRCMIGNLIYDPCFSIAQKGFVYCQVNVDESTGFLMKLTQALPKVSVPAVMQDNWAWFLQLKDGTYCSPFTGTRPFYGSGPNAQVAYYGCNSNNKDEQVVLLGDLTKGDVWTAQEAILTKTGTAWTIQSTQRVDIDTVWQ